jgi:hypothetical protein
VKLKRIFEDTIFQVPCLQASTDFATDYVKTIVVWSALHGSADNLKAGDGDVGSARKSCSLKKRSSITQLKINEA